MGQTQAWGSPPHTRGKVRNFTDDCGLIGITPAHAGKRIHGVIRKPPPWDHPRTRGEKRNPRPAKKQLLGSPPHTRGKVGLGIHGAAGDGITPAHAGKRSWSIFGQFSSRDHPRTRGEKFRSPVRPTASWGSPPHTRGKVIRGQLGGVGHGITPAHAGKRKESSCFSDSAWDHPRTRGEKLQHQICLLAGVGITPAHAGKRLNGSRF